MAAAGKRGAISAQESLQHNDHSKNDRDLDEQQFYIDQQPLAEQSVKKNIVFKLVDTKKKGASYIDGIADVMNPKTKKVERARLISGLDTIWFKEQKEIDANYINQNRRSIVFPRGAKIMAVPEDDVLLLEFLRIHPKNVGHPSNRKGMPDEFFEYNPEKEAEEALNREMAIINATIKASQQTETTIRKHAAFLGIGIFDAYAMPKPFDKIKQEYLVAAKRDPKRFEDTLNDKAVEITYLIRNAVMENKIDISSPDRILRWANGGSISTMQAGSNAIEYLVELATTNTQEGREFLQQLQSISQ